VFRMAQLGACHLAEYRCNVLLDIQSLKSEASMADPHIDVAARAFTRRLINDASQIESRCKSCGALIIGSVLDGLLEKEQVHIKHCPKIVGEESR